MGRYLSLDTEATGLEEDSLLVNLALVPVDLTQGVVLQKLSWERLIHCPSFEELKPNLNDWVVEHLESLLRKAHSEGISLDECRDQLDLYLKSVVRRPRTIARKTILNPDLIPLIIQCHPCETGFVYSFYRYWQNTIPE